MTTIINTPPTYSANVNCQPMSSHIMAPISITRLVEAIWKAMTEVKFAPRRNKARANATAAYEHDDEAMPRPVAVINERGRASGNNLDTCRLLTTDSTTAARKNPRINAHKISQVIAP